MNDFIEWFREQVMSMYKNYAGHMEFIDKMPKLTNADWKNMSIEKLKQLHTILSKGALEEVKESFIDKNTGLYNRTAFRRRVTARYNTVADVNNDAVHFALLDVSGVKLVNDHGKLGHVGGNTLIQTGAKAIMECIGKENSYHIDGDEFIIVFKNQTPEEISKKLKEINERLKVLWGKSHEKTVGVGLDKVGIHGDCASPKESGVKVVAMALADKWSADNAGMAPTERDRAEMLIRATVMVADERMAKAKNMDHHRSSFAEEAFEKAIKSGNKEKIIEYAQRYFLNTQPPSTNKEPHIQKYSQRMFDFER